MSRLDRITSDPDICHGEPTIRGLRYPVEDLLQQLASGMTIDQIIDDHPDLGHDDHRRPRVRSAGVGDAPGGAARRRVKFLVDAHLPARLARRLHESGHDAVHTSELPNGNRTTDTAIAELADTEDRVVVTKDRDFRESHSGSCGAPRRRLLVAHPR